MSTPLMILPAGDSNSIRLVRLPEDFEEHEAYRHVTALIASIEEQQPDTAFGVSNLSRIDSGMSLLVPCWTLGCRCLHF